MPPGAFASVLLVVLGQVQWDARLRAEGRALRDEAGDLQLEPGLGVESYSRETLLRARYDPQLIFREPSSRGTLDVLHRAELSLAWQVERDFAVTASQTGSAGVSDLSWLALPPEAAPPVNVQGISGPARSIVGEMSSITVAGRASDRLSVSLTGGFGVSGALRDEDLAVLPRTSTARLRAATTWTERRDAFSLVADASYGWVTTGYTTDTVDAGVAWRHAFTAASEHALTERVVARRDETLGPRYEVEMRGGVAALGGSDPVQSRGVMPTGSLLLLREAPRTSGAVAARLVLHYAPIVDPTTGAFTPHGDVSALVDVRLARQLFATGAFGLGYTPDPAPPFPRTVAQGGLALGYEAAPGVTISAGVRVARLPETEWAGVVSTTLRRHGRF